MLINFYYSKLSSPSRAVWMALKQLNLQFNSHPVNLRNGEQFRPEYLKINPSHTVPTVVDGDLSLWESRAILQYLFNQYAPDSSLYPKDPKKRAFVDRALNFDMSYNKSISDTILRPIFSGGQVTEQHIKSLEDNLKLLDTLIDNNKYVTGNDLTIADISILASTTYLGVKDYKDLESVLNVKAWFEKLKKELPYYEEVNGGVVETLKAYAEEHYVNE